MSTSGEDALRVDFSYEFLKGIDPVRPPSTIVIPTKYLDAMANMERQYWEIKARNYNVVIFFKKGKFYELYDCDAVIGNREFGLKMVFDSTNRGKMRLAGVPEQSFSEWARLFVFRGYKVGRVEQLREEENSPVKAKIVPRELVEVLTPGTLTDPAMLANHSEVYLLAVAPTAYCSVVDAFAVDLSRRVVLWCPCGAPQQVKSFQDGGIPNNATSAGADISSSEALEEDAMRALTALLQQLHPREVVMPLLEDTTASEHAKASGASIAKWIECDGYLVEPIPTTTTQWGRSPDASTRAEHSDISPARGLLAEYLAALKLERNIPLLAEATHYESHLIHHAAGNVPSGPLVVPTESSLLAWERRNDPGLVLDAATVSNLELVSNLQDGSETHSLHANVNGCVTNGGKRLFRAWILRPASTERVIRARQEVVRFLIETQLSASWASTSSEPSEASYSTPSSQVPLPLVEDAAAFGSSSGRKRPRSSTGGLDSRFGSIVSVDFDRCLSRLAEIKMESLHRISYVDPLVHYRKSLNIILSTIQAFKQMTEWSVQFDAACQEQMTPVPPLLRELLADIKGVAPSVAAIECLFDRQVAAESGIITPAPGTSTQYDAAVERLATLEAELHEIRRRMQQKHFCGADTTFTDLGKDLFLIEVSAADAPKLTPPGTVERARSAKSVKYAVDAISSLAGIHKEVTGVKSAALLNILQSVAAKMCDHCPALYTATSSLSYFDCLMNMARLHGRHPGMTIPTVITRDQGCPTPTVDTPACILATELVHPLLSGMPVPNSISLNQESGRLLVLTGPNMAGKSTLMRTVAINVILAQLGGPIMGQAMVLAPVDRIFTRIGARDASHKGQSTLYVELSETAELLRCATHRSLCLIDELGRGTSTHDGMAIAHATLQALKGLPTPPLTLFSTHYHALAMEEARCNQSVQLGYMDYALTPSSVGCGVPSITFLYRLVRGICDRSYGVEVALMAGIPPTLVHVAKGKSAELARRATVHENVETLWAFL